MIPRSDILPHLEWANETQPAPTFPGASTPAPTVTKSDEMAALRQIGRHARDEEEAGRFAAMLGLRS